METGSSLHSPLPAEASAASDAVHDGERTANELQEVPTSVRVRARIEAWKVLPHQALFEELKDLASDKEGSDTREKTCLMLGGLDFLIKNIGNELDEVDVDERDAVKDTVEVLVRSLGRLAEQDPEWVGRAVSRFEPKAMATSLVDLVFTEMHKNPEIGTSYSEILSSPSPSEEQFLEGVIRDGTFRATDLSDMERLPLRFIDNHRLYEESGSIAKEFFQRTVNFTDGDAVQGRVLQVMEKKGGYEIHNLFVGGGVGYVSPKVIPILCQNVSFQEVAWESLHVFQQPVQDTIASLLDRGVKPKRPVDLSYRETVDVEAAQQMVDRGHAVFLAQNHTLLLKEAVPTVLDRALSSEEGARAFVESIPLGEYRKTPLSEEQARKIFAVPGLAETLIRRLDYLETNKVAFFDAAVETEEGVQAVVRALDLSRSALGPKAVDALFSRATTELLSRPLSCNAEGEERLIQKALADPQTTTVFAKNFEHFTRLSAETVDVLLTSGRFPASIASHLFAFRQDQRLTVAKLLLSTNERFEVAHALAGASPDFVGPHIFDEEIFRVLLQTGALARVDRPTLFSSEQQRELAHYYIDSKRLDLLQKNISLFDVGALDVSIADILMRQQAVKLLATHADRFQSFSVEAKQKIDTFQAVSLRLEQSPSRTIRRMKDQLTNELSSASDVEQAFQKIESVFLRNHLPLAAKGFLAEEIIYGPEHYKKAFSPSLKAASPREARMLLYRDIINIHIDTGNPSMRGYLLDIKNAESVLEQLDRKEELSASDGAKAESFFRKAGVLATTSHREGVSAAKSGSLQEQFQQWKTSFGVREGQTFQDRLSEMFLRPAGVASIDAALARMEASKHRADIDNRAFAERYKNGITLEQNDLLKGVESPFLLSYLQNGNVCREMLGYAAGSDRTPLDTDVSRVDISSATQEVRATWRSVAAKDYGDMILVMRPTEERFLRTDTVSRESLNGLVRDQAYGRLNKYELFSSGYLGHTHENIRTGVPFTEVRSILMKEPERRSLLDIKMDIVANGYFVMIADGDGKPLFTPEEFDRMRTLYEGTEILPGSLMKLDRTVMNEAQRTSLEQLQSQIAEERASIEQAREAIETRVRESLEKIGIGLRIDGELAVGAEVLNTGSTARLTNIPGETVDFDLVIRLDESDLSRQNEIEVMLNELLPGKEQPGGSEQWRRTGVSVEGASVDIDITFTGKPEVQGVFSHETTAQRLASLEAQSAEDADWVRANIVCAKQLLKKAGIYKKLDGGLGGLGVENWILQHGGSFANAREAVLRAAINERGAVRSFEECAARYAIPDPGINLMDRMVLASGEEKTTFRHDNFFYFLNRDGSHGYEKFVRALQAL